MNDKIYEFATRAGLITFESIHDSMAVTPSIESVAKARKFAEMIVRESMEVARHSILSRSGIDPHTFTGTVTTVEEIRKHFGVKE